MADECLGPINNFMQKQGSKKVSEAMVYEAPVPQQGQSNDFLLYAYYFMKKQSQNKYCDGFQSSMEDQTLLREKLHKKRATMAFSTTI